jgi:hypothetical protein
MTVFRTPSPSPAALEGAITAYAEEVTAGLRREIEELKGWKDSAMNVMGSMSLQEIGKVLGMTPGTDIGPEILPRINSLKEERDKAVAFASRIERGDEHFLKKMDEQMQAIAALPLGKSIHENLAQAVGRTLTERNSLAAQLAAAQEVARIINAGENHYLGCYCHVDTSLDAGWCSGCRLRLAVAALTAPSSVTEAAQVMDLDALAWEQVKRAASESKWIPPEYMVNDWVSDVCEFLIGTEAAPTTEHPDAGMLDPVFDGVMWSPESGFYCASGTYGVTLAGLGAFMHIAEQELARAEVIIKARHTQPDAQDGSLLDKIRQARTLFAGMDVRGLCTCDGALGHEDQCPVTVLDAVFDALTAPSSVTEAAPTTEHPDAQDGAHGVRGALEKLLELWDRKDGSLETSYPHIGAKWINAARAAIAAEKGAQP